jgi:hypothetical protein
MEDKITAAFVWCTERDPSMYIRMRVLPWVTLLLAWGRLGSISAPFGEPASRLLVQLNVQNMEEGKIATAWAQFGATESPSMYIRMRVLPWSNFC